ncbi:hypothetical protein GCM10027275_03300 [Rhabdobacter roseus]|uniref:Outer membrane beta-barrel protein n=1 Tax=Rhabdobacter roseus TaxID=1655419 RepID=A0A840TQD1_9BACT|nr:hypothetical protein [Rhabdobacter roseus]MBB5282218.1 hypothetical protein [Rhabdobacter roseus]
MKNTTTPFLLIVLVLCGLGGELRAQEVESPPPKWEVGVDLLRFFDRDRYGDIQFSTYSFIARRKLSENRALRIRPLFGLGTNINPPLPGANQPHLLILSLDLGHEWQRRYGKFVHYYGADLAGRYQYRDATIGLGTSGSAPNYTYEKDVYWRAGVGLFTGGKYFLTNRISLSLESTVNLHLGGLKLEAGSANPRQAVTSTHSWGFTLDFNTLSAFYLSYYF